MHETGQDVSDLLASVLRIDVSAGKSYAVPKDNPFVGHMDARPEVWAYGFRNPWRMSFDRKTGALWLGDVGWQLWEMVYRVQRGGNYGWSIKEGPQSVRPELAIGPTEILSPVIAHPRSEAASVTGGYVYRGKRHKELAGSYVYGDYVTGKIWSLDPGESKVDAPVYREAGGYVLRHHRLCGRPTGRAVLHGLQRRHDSSVGREQDRCWQHCQVSDQAVGDGFVFQR